MTTRAMVFLVGAAAISGEVAIVYAAPKCELTEAQRDILLDVAQLIDGKRTLDIDDLTEAQREDELRFVLMAIVGHEETCEKYAKGADALIEEYGRGDKLEKKLKNDFRKEMLPFYRQTLRVAQESGLEVAKVRAENDAGFINPHKLPFPFCIPFDCD